MISNSNKVKQAALSSVQRYEARFDADVAVAKTIFHGMGKKWDLFKSL